MGGKTIIGMKYKEYLLENVFYQYPWIVEE